MSLPRTPEPPPEDPRAEAMTYETMDHGDVNRQFVDDLNSGGEIGPRIVDLGCGPAWIAIEICQQKDDCELMGIDASIDMLEIAKMQIDFAGLLDRISLEHADVADLRGFSEQMADTVVSNSLLHHLVDPAAGIRAALHLVRDGGRVFIRDLSRPKSEQEVEQLVAKHASGESEDSQQLLRQSLHAALTLPEIRGIAAGLGIGEVDVQMTSDRHWTIDWQRPIAT